MEIQFSYTALYEVVARSLSIIGKRSRDEKGNSRFEDVTLGTNEKSLIEDYLRQAVIDLAAETASFITDAVDDTVTLAFPDNHNEKLEDFIRRSCKAYCVSYALYSWFTITAPSLSDKYMADCNRQLNALKKLIYEKKEPEKTNINYTDVNGTVAST